MTTPGIHQAREWAEVSIDEERVAPGEAAYAAAAIIQSLPDQWINAEHAQIVARKMRSIAEHHTAGERHAYLRCAEAVESLIPTPPLRTLATLIEEGNDPQKYQWMQATVVDEDDQKMIGVIQNVHKHVVWVAFENGKRKDYRHYEVVPRPDLPPLKWPGSEPHISMEEMWVDDGSSPADAIQELAQKCVKHALWSPSTPEPPATEEEDLVRDRLDLHPRFQKHSGTPPEDADLPSPGEVSFPAPTRGEWWKVTEERFGEGIAQFLGEDEEFPWLIHFKDGMYDKFKMGSVTRTARMVPEVKP